MLLLAFKESKHNMTDFEVLNESFPRLGKQVFLTWGTKECRDLLCSLITDSRGGTRQGFPPEAAAAIIRLLSSHDEQFAQFNDSHEIIVPFRSLAPPTKYTSNNGMNILVKLSLIVASLGLAAGLAKAAYQAGMF